MSVGVLSLKLVDELDDVAVTVLAKVLGGKVCLLILALDVVDADLALLLQFLYQKLIPQRDMLCARTVGTVAGDVQRRRVIDIQRHAAEVFIKAQLQQNTAPFIVKAPASSSASMVDCAVSPCSPTLIIIGVLASVTMYDGLDLRYWGCYPSWHPQRQQA